MRYGRPEKGNPHPAPSSKTETILRHFRTSFVLFFKTHIEVPGMQLPTYFFTGFGFGGFS